MRKIPAEIENPIDNLVYKVVEFVAPYFHKFGITPNMITTMSTICGFSSAYLIYKHQFLLSAGLFMFAYIFDCLDGYVARMYNMVTKFGDYYDHVTDMLKFIAYSIALAVVNLKLFLMFVPIIIYLLFLCGIHITYQEYFYDTQDASDTLGLLRMIFKRPKNVLSELKYTRYFGLGTINLLCVLIILVYGSFYK